MHTITVWWVLGENSNEETKLICLSVENILHRMRFTEAYFVYGVIEELKIVPKPTVARLIAVNTVSGVKQKFSKGIHLICKYRGSCSVKNV